MMLLDFRECVADMSGDLDRTHRRGFRRKLHLKFGRRSFADFRSGFWQISAVAFCRFWQWLSVEVIDFLGVDVVVSLGRRKTVLSTGFSFFVKIGCSHVYFIWCF
jgi:hypothetical protein